MQGAKGQPEKTKNNQRGRLVRPFKDFVFISSIHTKLLFIPVRFFAARKRKKMLSKEIGGILEDVIDPYNYPLF